MPKTDALIINTCIVLLAVSPAFALGEGNRNLLLIGAMLLAPVILLRYPVIIKKIDIPLTVLMFCMIAFPLAFHPETMRWSTVLYSCMFGLNFMAFARILYFRIYTSEDFTRLLEYLIYAYGTVFLIQQFCVLTGLPIFNVSNYSPEEPWKLNSLMSEPSHAARVISLLMYLFILNKKQIDPDYTFQESWTTSRYVWLAYFWMVLTMGSSTVFIFTVIVFAQFFNPRKILKTVLPILTVLFLVFTFSENKSVKRVQNIVSAMVTLDEKKIIKADHSASFRIVPTLQGARFIGSSSLNDWFGYGVDADAGLIKPLPTVKYGNAGAFYMWVNFGLITAILYWTFSFSIIFIRKNPSSALLWFFLIFMYGGVNNQIIWLTLTLLFTHKKISGDRTAAAVMDKESYR